MIVAAKQRSQGALPATGAFVNAPQRPSSRAGALGRDVAFAPAANSAPAPARPPSRVGSATSGKELVARVAAVGAEASEERQVAPSQVPALLRHLPDPQYPRSDPILFHIGGILVVPEDE